MSHERLWQAHDLPTRTRSNCSNVTQPPGDTASKARCICCTSAGFTARRKHSQVRLQKPPEGKPEQRARTVQLWHQASQPFSRATQARANTNGHGRSTELSLCVKVLQVAHGVAKVGIRLIGDEPFMREQLVEQHNGRQSEVRRGHAWPPCTGNSQPEGGSTSSTVALFFTSTTRIFVTKSCASFDTEDQYSG